MTRYSMLNILHNGFQAKQVRKTSETKACGTHHACLIPPSPWSFGPSQQKLCPHHQPFCISPLCSDKAVFSPHQQPGDCSLRNQSIIRRLAALTSYLVSRLLGLSGRGWDGGGRSHSSGLQINPGRAGIGGVAGAGRAMEQPSCKGQRITIIVLTYLEVLLFY